MKVRSGEFRVRISEETALVLQKLPERQAGTTFYRFDVVDVVIEEGKWFILDGPARYAISPEEGTQVLSDINKEIPVPEWGGGWSERNIQHIKESNFDGNVGGKIDGQQGPQYPVRRIIAEAQ